MRKLTLLFLASALGASVFGAEPKFKVGDELTLGGRILIVGFASGRIPTLPINMALIKGFSVVGVRAGEFARKNPEKGKENNQEIRRICEEGYFDPYICKTFPLSEAKDSIQYLSERKLIGKVVIKID